MHTHTHGQAQSNMPLQLFQSCGHAKLILKKQQTPKQHGKLPSMQRVKAH